jgi:hypothetical protein
MVLLKYCTLNNIIFSTLSSYKSKKSLAFYHENKQNPWLHWYNNWENNRYFKKYIKYFLTILEKNP